MAEVTEITIVNGIPTGPSGEVPTLAPVRDAIGIVTETAPATDTASSGLNGRLQRIAQRITSLIALVPASLGSKAAASSFATTDSTEDIARVGIITETAPASDTASSGLNGRLQRIAQNLTTAIGRAVAQLGARTIAQSPAVNLATDDLLVAAVGPASATAYSDPTGAASGTTNAILKGLYVESQDTTATNVVLTSAGSPLEALASINGGTPVTMTGSAFLSIAAGQATTTVKSGAGVLYAINFNGPASATSTMVIYDNTAASGTVIGRPLATAVVSPVSLRYGNGLAFATGLTIITAVANGADMTVIYR